MPELLIEIGCEEIPARFVDMLGQQLHNKTLAWLEGSRITHGEACIYTTPRRLALLVHDVATTQTDLSEEIRGPALKIAKTDTGEWSLAALSFAKKHDQTVDDLYAKEYKGVSYLYANCYHRGGETVTLLADGLPAVFSGLETPYSMRWGADSYTFIRPVRWLVCLFGDQVVPVSWSGVKAGNITQGHRFLGEPVEAHAEHYEEILSLQSVVVNSATRQQLILNQLRELEAEHDWVIPLDDKSLLAEVTHLVEYPTAVVGSFANEYLSLPRAILITFMREHQRYFYVENQQGELLPFFVTISNGDGRGRGIIAKGNEKVLQARLADAQFFFNEDQKLTIPEAVSKLQKVSWQKGLGLLSDKLERMTLICEELAATWELDTKSETQLLRAAKICKFALVTQVVTEFPELAGEISLVYALNGGEDEEVAIAIHEHYLPTSATGQLASTKLGTILALVDRIDTLAAYFGRGRRPSGSFDPYGLRRQATGVIRMLLQPEYANLSLVDLVGVALNKLAQKDLLKLEAAVAQEELIDFLAIRVQKQLVDEGIREDIIKAVLAAGIDQPAVVKSKALLLTEMLGNNTLQAHREAFVRVANLAQKAEAVLSINSLLLHTEAEKKLVQLLSDATETFDRAKSQNDVSSMYGSLKSLVPAIEVFFDEVLIMVEDQELQFNRLAVLAQINSLCMQFAVFTKLNF